jgi:hypothetical protein
VRVHKEGRTSAGEINVTRRIVEGGIVDAERMIELMLMNVLADVSQGLTDIRENDDDAELARKLLSRYPPANPLQEYAAKNHEEVLLINAHSTVPEPDEACFYFATWAEHVINRFIVVTCRRRGSGLTEAERIIGKKKLPQKLTWLPPLDSESAPERDKSVTRLKTIGAYRDEFVHYKWKPASATQEQAQRAALMDVAPKVEAYLRDFDEQYVFRSQSARIRRILPAARDWSEEAKRLSIRW